MTVTYSEFVANVSFFGFWWKTMTLYRGSLYKLVWRELLSFLGVYYIIEIIRVVLLPSDLQEIFVGMRDYFLSNVDSIPMTFIMGLFVTQVVARWWKMNTLLPTPDMLAILVNSAIHGNSERCRGLRRTIVRYAMVSYILTFVKISPPVRKRFPDLKSLTVAGLLLEREQLKLERSGAHALLVDFVIPLAWAARVVSEARRQRIITCDLMEQTLLKELAAHRCNLAQVLQLICVPIPLVYTQVVTLATYAYVCTMIVAYQAVDTDDLLYLKMIFPLWATIQFVFFVGWLKVAEVLINPFGEDDDDFEMNKIIDRNLLAASMIVDDMQADEFTLEKDKWYYENLPEELRTQSNLYDEVEESAEYWSILEEDSTDAKFQHLNIYQNQNTLNGHVYAEIKNGDRCSFKSSAHSSDVSYESIKPTTSVAATLKTGLNAFKTKIHKSCMTLRKRSNKGDKKRLIESVNDSGDTSVVKPLFDAWRGHVEQIDTSSYEEGIYESLNSIYQGPTGVEDRFEEGAIYENLGASTEHKEPPVYENIPLQTFRPSYPFRDTHLFSGPDYENVNTTTGGGEQRPDLESFRNVGYENLSDRIDKPKEFLLDLDPFRNVGYDNTSVTNFIPTEFPSVFGTFKNADYMQRPPGEFQGVKRKPSYWGPSPGAVGNRNVPTGMRSDSGEKLCVPDETDCRISEEIPCTMSANTVIAGPSKPFVRHPSCLGSDQKPTQEIVSTDNSKDQNAFFERVKFYKEFEIHL